MIEFLIALLITIQVGGSPCDLGAPVDWYAWTDAHPTAEVILSLNLPQADLWLWDGGDSCVLFVFDQDVESAVSEVVHGECAVEVEP